MPNIENYLTYKQKELLQAFFDNSWQTIIAGLDSSQNCTNILNDLDFLDAEFVNTILNLDHNIPLNTDTELKLYKIFSTLSENLLDADTDLIKVTNNPTLLKLFESNIKHMIDLRDSLKDIATNYLAKIASDRNELSSNSIEGSEENPAKLKPYLIDIILTAIDPEKSSNNPKIEYENLDSIRESIGQDLFQHLIKKYQLDLNNFYLDDIRMLIIGTLANCQQDWRENPFILNLFTACNIDYHNGNDASILQQLRSHMSMNPEVLQRISKQTFKENLINRALHFMAKNFMPELYNLLPIKFKATRSFKKDFSIVTTMANINDWQNKPDEKSKKFASTEFVFNKLSNADLHDGAIVPTLNPQGEIILCKIKNFIDEKSIHGFALIPTDPASSQDIKVVFKNSTLLGEAICDIEHYFPYRAFKHNKSKILNSLNNIVEEFKRSKELPPEQKDAIALDIGGHGTGGTIAQLLAHELAAQRAKTLIKNNHTNHQAELDAMLSKNIENQYNLEQQYNQSAATQSADNKAKHISRVKKYAKKHLFNLPPKATTASSELADTSDLYAINNFKLSTVNAGGIPNKIRLNFIQAMHIIKSDSSNEFNLSCDKIINAQDLVAKSGSTDLAAYTTAELMPTTIMQFQSPEKTIYQEKLKDIAISSALLATKFVLSKVAIISIPFLGNYLSSLLSSIDYSEELKKIEKNITNMKKHAAACHRDTYFNYPAEHLHSPGYYQELTNNQLDPKIHDFHKTLTTKIPSSNTNKFLRKLKKSFYSNLQAIKNIYNKISPEPINYVQEDMKGRGVMPIFTPNINVQQHHDESKSNDRLIQEIKYDINNHLDLKKRDSKT